MTKKRRRLAARCAALGHPVRLAIVQELTEAGAAGRVVRQLQNVLRVPGSTLSHHLDALHREGLVRQAREGRFLRYRAASGALRAMAEVLLGLAAAADGDPVPGAATARVVVPRRSMAEVPPALPSEPIPSEPIPSEPIPTEPIPTELTTEPVAAQDHGDPEGDDAVDWRAW